MNGGHRGASVARLVGMIRVIRLAWLAVATAACLPAWAQPAPLPSTPTEPGLSGTWLAPAEDDDDVDALIDMSPDGNGWQGHIRSIRETRPGQKWHDDSLCQQCPGTAQGRRLQGLRVLWDLHETADHHWRGQTLDPGDGHVYRCDIVLQPDRRTLTVTAYIGLPLLGHTMVWRRWP